MRNFKQPPSRLHNSIGVLRPDVLSDSAASLAPPLYKPRCPQVCSLFMTIGWRLATDPTKVSRGPVATSTPLSGRNKRRAKSRPMTPGGGVATSPQRKGQAGGGGRRNKPQTVSRLSGDTRGGGGADEISQSGTRTPASWAEHLARLLRTGYMRQEPHQTTNYRRRRVSC